MAHMPKSDVQQLWNGMGNNKNWSTLENDLKQRLGESKGISNNLIQMLLSDMNSLKNQPFPNSPDQLYQVLNSELSQKSS